MSAVPTPTPRSDFALDEMERRPTPLELMDFMERLLLIGAKIQKAPDSRLTMQGTKSWPISLPLRYESFIHTAFEDKTTAIFLPVVPAL
jgi:hypothetical protein